MVEQGQVQGGRSHVRRRRQSVSLAFSMHLCLERSHHQKIVEEARLERQMQGECHEQEEINRIRQEQECEEQKQAR